MCDEFQEILKVLCHKPLESTRPFRIVLCTFSTGRQSLHQRVAALVLLIGGCRDETPQNISAFALQSKHHSKGASRSRTQPTADPRSTFRRCGQKSDFSLQGHYDFETS